MMSCTPTFVSYSPMSAESGDVYAAGFRPGNSLLAGALVVLGDTCAVAQAEVSSANATAIRRIVIFILCLY